MVFFELFTSAIWAYSFGSTNESSSFESILSSTVRAKFMAVCADIGCHLNEIAYRKPLKSDF